MPHQPVTSTKRNFARSMRREPTEAEDRLWQELRGRRLDNIKFKRQVPMGRYVADFVCAEARLIVEIDGSQHAESRHDQERDAVLKARGFRVLRFWNDDVIRDIDNVCQHIVIVADLADPT
ncbi:endonuclease domain-containing protein [Mesorhizobium sp. M00.F.Ca.ET.038.03.1.1]|nr:endonuclease domain-containing protein [Mesorhizobium sp. M00.F.Ca.ET.038.03.1.1]